LAHHINGVFGREFNGLATFSPEVADLFKSAAISGWNPNFARILIAKPVPTFAEYAPVVVWRQLLPK
jgi:hypothetical protein